MNAPGMGQQIATLWMLYKDYYFWNIMIWSFTFKWSGVLWKNFVRLDTNGSSIFLHDYKPGIQIAVPQPVTVATWYRLTDNHN